MADLEDVTLDGRPLQSLRVADLKAALEERGLSKSGQKNALIKRLKGALMLENLQRTSTAHVGLQPNSQIGEEMSQNSFIKQYLAKQQELLRQRLEREAREAYETNDQEDHNDINNSACPPQVQDASPAVTDHFKPPGPSTGQAAPEGLSHRHQEAAMSRPPASGSVAQDRSEAAADSDEDDSEDGEDDGDDDDDDWDSKVQGRLSRQPVRAPMVRERSAASCQPQQQHMPSLLSPQLRQPTPPPSPPPELSFPLPDTPKQSPPSPDGAPSGRSPSSSSSGSSSSGSRSSSPEPHGGHAERKPGPLTLLARKMESEGAFSGAEWHSRNRQDNCSSVSFPSQVCPEGLVSSVLHLPTASHAPINLGSNKGRAHVPISVLKATTERDAELEREKALELRRQEQQRKLEQERAMDEERVRAEQQKALEKEQFERKQALEREKALQMKRELALEREKLERDIALAKEKERALELERQKALEREQEERKQREREEQARAQALERERALEQERVERERALEAERIERERMEREKAERLEQERLEREAALARERQEKERMEREQALEQKIEQERIEREKALELEREKLAREMALEKERVEREKTLEQERIERERIQREKALEQERIERERIQREKALERERIEREKALEQERIEREKALERERIERERIEREKALEQEKIEREKALEQERIEREKALEQERIEREKALEQERIEQERIERERIEREKALEQERIEQERIAREKALEQERIAREKALEQERIAREKALEQERIAREKALEQERIARERALEQERIAKEKAIEQERIEREKVLEKERIERERALELEKIEREKVLEQERIAREKAQEQEKIEREKALEQEKIERERIKRENFVQQERIEMEKALENERMEQERAERKVTLERERLEKVEPGRVEREKVQEQARQALEEREAKENALEFVKNLAEKDSLEKKQNTAHVAAEKSRMTEVESEEHFPPTREIGFVPLPTPTPLSTGTSPKVSTEADKEEGEVHGPVTCEGQAEESNKSPPSLFKKFRFTRNTPLQPQTASRIIKRPRTFSDTPQHSAPVMSDCNAESQLHKQQSADVEVGGRMISKVKHVEAMESVEKGDSNLISENKEDRDKIDAALKGSIKMAVDSRVCPSSPLGPPGRGRDAKKTEKKDKRRSSSNDSSSSESDSSSSHSTGSSSSSVEKAFLSQPSRDDSSSLQVIEVSKEHEKIASIHMDISSENVQFNKDVLTKLNEAPSQDDGQRRKDCYNEDEKPENSQGESAVSEPEKGAEGNNETPKAFSTRKISLSSKSSPGSTENDHELGSAGGRKRRWGSSTAVTAKKPSISITTDSLKSLIPDIKPALNQEVVMSLHPEDPVLSETEDEDKNHADQELQICRTVTQDVNVENQENGQKETKRRREESEEEDLQDEKETKTYEDPTYLQAIEAPSPLHTQHEEEINTVTPSDILIRRSVSQQKIGVSITIDDPVRTTRQPSPPRGDVSNIVHVCNLVRPFTLGQLKELLSRTGTLVEDGFWIDKIKSHCYVTYSSSEEAVATRAALHGVKWPQSNPKVLRVDFCQQDELDFHKGLGSGERPGIGGQSHSQGLPSLLPERDQWAEREREMGRRERARAEREWDRDKIREFGKTPEEREAGAHRSRSRERRRKEREKSKEKKAEKKEKTEDPPAKLLDDLFRKTKAVPCIYWLPLTEEQYLQREMARVERRKEREKQRKKDEEEAELKKKEEENKERMRAGGGITVDRNESEKDKIRDRDRARDRGRDRERDREADKRREGYRRPGGYAPPSGRRSRSRSDPRERRR